MSGLVSKIAEFLKEYNLQDKTVVVGFSGGYDSMCLLDVLSKLRQKREEFFDLTVIAAHYNHNWRGEEALREQEVCRLFAASRGFEFFTKTAPVGLKKSENEARIARYEFFEEAMENYDADAVFTAHNKDDNAETVLYRAIKGTGLYGLKGISIKRDCFYRPLLKILRSDIVAYCEANNLQPNVDSSNFDTTYKRNYLRLNVIPALEQVNPQLKETLNTLAEVANSEDSIIEEYLATLRDKIYEGERIITSEFIKLSKPVKMRFIHEYLQLFDLDYDFKRISEIYRFIEANQNKRNGSTISLAAASWLYVDDKIIETIPQRKRPEDIYPEEVVIFSEGEYEFGNKKLIIKPYEADEVFVFPESTASFAYVDFSKLLMPIVLRTRNDGDIINPFGMSGSMKLKKYFNAKGVNRHKRDEILLLTQENEVLWAVGVGLSNKIAVDKVPTHVIEVI
ncbi:MAG: tRNA lysidine(34) synthetase TilS [Cyanobacteria bacterium SIG31]|nr:tRNA lysidine(34) synthetase TilS [Cyanobacteria bacterium SIG31]